MAICQQVAELLDFRLHCREYAGIPAEACTTRRDFFKAFG
jgi:hypothetical protein